MNPATDTAPSLAALPGVVFCMVCQRVRVKQTVFVPMPDLLAEAGERASSTLCPSCAAAEFGIPADQYERCCCAA